MGFFSHIGDVISGKIDKRNILLNDNLNLIEERIENFKGKTRTNRSRAWCDACASSAYVFLDFLFFIQLHNKDEIKFVEPLRNQLDRVSKKSAYDMFKVLVRYRLACNSGSSDFHNFIAEGEPAQKLAEPDVLFERFRDDVFEIWGFTEEDEDLYDKFEALLSEPTIYFLKTYREFVAKGYGFKPENTITGTAVFSSLLERVFSRTFHMEISKRFP